jgi:hypothetical protein
MEALYHCIELVIPHTSFTACFHLEWLYEKRPIAWQQPVRDPIQRWKIKYFEVFERQEEFSLAKEPTY